VFLGIEVVFIPSGDLMSMPVVHTNANFCGTARFALIVC